MERRRLFVDIDDTLVIYDDGRNAPHPYGIYRDIPYTINEKLLKGIDEWNLGNPESWIIIWSGGGEEYARMWAERLGLIAGWRSGTVTPMVKDQTTFIFIREYDIVIDDMDLGGLRTHKPNEWPEEVK